MRILVLSDSHGSASAIHRAIESEKDISSVIFLGDGLRELERVKSDYPDISFYAVRGNCDMDITAKLCDDIELCGIKIFLCHGHCYNVKSDMSAIVTACKNTGAILLLYGHTHIANISFHGNIIAVNPGSVSRSRNGSNSYAVIDLVRGRRTPYPAIKTL